MLNSLSVFIIIMIVALDGCKEWTDDTGNIKLRAERKGERAWGEGGGSRDSGVGSETEPIHQHRRSVPSTRQRGMLQHK